MKASRFALGPVVFFAVFSLAAGLATACGDDDGSGSPATDTQDAGSTEPQVTDEPVTSEPASETSLSSSAFGNNETIPVVYTCAGDNISPPLAISGVPENASALALIMHDPDAPISGGFTHWVVWNIDPTTAVVPEDTVPFGGTEGLNGGGGSGYTGPCPPSGTHGYEFTLYAVDAPLTLDAASGKAQVESAIEGHVLAQALLVGTHSRQ